MVSSYFYTPFVLFSNFKPDQDPYNSGVLCSPTLRWVSVDYTCFDHFLEALLG